MTENKLNPCYICGSEAEAFDDDGYGHWWVKCKQSCMRTAYVMRSREEAEGMWNGLADRMREKQPTAPAVEWSDEAPTEKGLYWLDK